MVEGQGKFEELVVASHDIAASTAQLVAASRVKARPKSEKLKSLKASSRDGESSCSLFLLFDRRPNCIMVPFQIQSLANSTCNISEE